MIAPIAGKLERALSAAHSQEEMSHFVATFRKLVADGVILLDKWYRGGVNFQVATVSRPHWKTSGDRSLRMLLRAVLYGCLSR